MDGCGLQGGFQLAELFAAGVTTLDIVVVYALLQVRRGRMILALWTACLNIVLPFIGYAVGEFSAHLFSGWSSLLSGVLLALIGLHMLLQDDSGPQATQVHPFLVALAVSLDSFSVSVSFGMLQMNKLLFIAASGFFSLFFAYAVLVLRTKLGIRNGRVLRIIAGSVLTIMGIMSCFS